MNCPECDQAVITDGKCPACGAKVEVPKAVPAAKTGKKNK
jgi:rubrerythrin